MRRWENTDVGPAEAGHYVLILQNVAVARLTSQITVRLAAFTKATAPKRRTLPMLRCQVFYQCANPPILFPSSAAPARSSGPLLEQIVSADRG